MNVYSLSIFFHEGDKCVRKRSRAEKVTGNREMWSTFQRQKSKIHIAHFSKFVIKVEKVEEVSHKFVNLQKIFFFKAELEMLSD